ncbi:MFS transporter [Paraburkholderia ferrariae]|uniref:MFS transporter n=1 Tax=Paraburkholderia ferrariae TaxID=386056 RepID=UPI0014700A8B|nr:MFS transporter [Paraburkholderia ferrariae]
MVAVAVLPLYASQTLLVSLDASLHLGSKATLITGLTMLGYAVGLVTLVPLTDRFSNRPLIAATLIAQIVCLFASAVAPVAWVFLVATFALGVTASVVQMLVPAAASLAPVASRGAVVGTVMSGLMLGIMLSRPIAAFVGGLLGWRAFYAGDAMVLAAVALVVLKRLPDVRPVGTLPYRTLLASMAQIVAREPVLRRRALYQGLLMAGFNLFWSSVAIVLSRAPLHLDSYAIAIFALAGSGGVIGAPLAGRAADRGHDVGAAIVAHGLAILAVLIAAASIHQGIPRTVAVVMLALAALLIDSGVVGDQAIGRRAINMLTQESRGRINGLFTGLFFVGSAVGATLAGPVLARFGWLGVCAATLFFFAAATLLHLRDTIRKA